MASPRRSIVATKRVHGKGVAWHLLRRFISQPPPASYASRSEWTGGSNVTFCRGGIDDLGSSPTEFQIQLVARDLHFSWIGNHGAIGAALPRRPRLAQPNLSTVRRAHFSVPVSDAERDIVAFNPATGPPCDSPARQTSFQPYLTANLSSTGMTTTVNGVPASSLTCGSGEPKALPPTIAFS
jgi:hypothetical protein